MQFSVGVEYPKNPNGAFGLVVPALCNDEYDCLSAADTQQDIPHMAREAILLTIEDMIDSGKFMLEDIKDEGHLVYQNTLRYPGLHWFVIEVDLSEFEGKPKRINISLPDTLIHRIDDRVKDNPTYKDRSHFLAEAARHELANKKGA